MRQRLQRDYVLYLAGSLLLLLAFLAWIQYRWIGELSRAEWERMRVNLDIAISRFADDFDREILRVVMAFQPGEPGGARSVPERYDRWIEEAPYPDLVKTVWIIRPGEAPEIERYDPASGTFQGLDHLPQHLVPALQRFGNRPPTGPGLRGPIIDDIPAVVVPLERERRLLPSRDEATQATRPSYLIAELDVGVIVERLVPDLVAVNLTATFGGDFRLEMIRHMAQTNQEIVYRSDPGDDPIERADASRPLFMMRDIRGLPPEGGAGPAPGVGPRGVGPRAGMGRGPRPDPPPAHMARWSVQVEHRLGSLDEAVGRNRRRNFALSLAVLGILAASIVILTISLERMRRLSDQQMEFIAGVTHELNTPLAAIHSAGQNLADGVVRDEGQVRRYGLMIVDQGRRLSNMVGEVLEFSGLLTGGRDYRSDAVELATIIDESLGDLAWLIEERDAKTQIRLPSTLPPVAGDPDALRRVFDNLLGNAIKHGQNGIGIVVTAVEDQSNRIAITIQDDGPGIDPRDVGRVFEPFYRGRGAMDRQTRGSGLGLSIVRGIIEAHRGSIQVESRSGKGTRFLVKLPIHRGKARGHG